MSLVERDQTIGVCQGVCLGTKCDNESSCGIVSEGVSADEKPGIYLRLINFLIEHTLHSKALHHNVNVCDTAV